MKLKINVDANTKKATSALSSLGKSLKSTGSEYSKFYSRNKKINEAFSNISKDANRASLSINGLAKEFKGLNQVVGASKLYGLSNLFASIIKASMDSIETQNMFGIAMGDATESANEFLTKLSELSGMDLTNLQDASGTFGLMARSMGVGAKDAEKLSLNLTQLGLDISSAFNVSTAQAMGDLRSALVGQSETVYKYGLDITEASLVQEAMNLGIEKSVRNMSQAEKMTLRYAVMIRQSSLIHGDFARTINQPANQLRILRERMVSLARAIGNIFIPMLTVVLPYLNAFVSILIDVANAIARFFGFKPSKATGMQSSVGTTKDTMDKLGSSTGRAGKNMDKLKKSAKEMKQVLMGFDEINTLNLPTDTGDGGEAGAIGGGGGLGGIGGDILGDLDLPSMGNILDQLSQKTSDLKDKMIPVLKEILTVVGLIALGFISWSIAGLILGLGEGIGLLAGFSKLMSDIAGFFLIVKEVGFISAFKELAPQLALATGLFLTVAGIVVAFQGFKKLFEEAKPSIEDFGVALGGVALIAGGLALIFTPFVGTIALITGAIALLGIAIYKYWDEIQATKDKILKWKDEVEAYAIARITELVASIVDGFINLATDIYNKMMGVRESIYKWRDQMIAIAVAEVVKIVGKIVEGFVGLATKIYETIDDTYAKITQFKDNMIARIQAEVPKIISSVVGFFTGLPTKVYEAIDDTYGKINQFRENMVARAGAEIPKIITKIKDYFTGLPGQIYDKIKGAYEKIKDIGEYLRDGIIGGMKANLVTMLTNWKNSFIGGIKKVFNIKSPSRVMRDQVGKFLGQGIGVGLENETDGIVNKAYGISDGIIGAFKDVGVNPMVKYSIADFGTPNLDANMGVLGSVSSKFDFTSDELVSSIYSAVFSGITNAMASAGNSDIVMKVGETEIGRVTVNSINKITKQEGKLPLII